MVNAVITAHGATQPAALIKDGASLVVRNPGQDGELRFSSGAEASCSGFADVGGLSPGSLQALQRLYTGGVRVPSDEGQPSKLWRLSFGGEVAADGNCLFTSLARSLGLSSDETAELRRRAIRRFLAEVSSGAVDRGAADAAIKNLYCPSLESGWGVHFLLEHKLLLRLSDEEAAAAAISELQSTGMDATAAAETVYRDLATPVDSCDAWAEYMAVDGGAGGQHKVVTLQYVEDGLLSAEVSASASFGDDLAIESLASELRRDIYVVQAHAPQAVGEGTEGGLFFLPHSSERAGSRTHGGMTSSDTDDMVDDSSHPQPQQHQQLPPLFLLMRGSDVWLSGGDHYEPLLTAKPPPGCCQLTEQPYEL